MLILNFTHCPCDYLYKYGYKATRRKEIKHLSFNRLSIKRTSAVAFLKMNARAQINTLYLFLFIITKVGTEKHLAQIETIVQIRRQQPLISRMFSL